jgi:hypothetical protein
MPEGGEILVTVVKEDEDEGTVRIDRGSESTLNLKSSCWICGGGTRGWTFVGLDVLVVVIVNDEVDVDVVDAVDVVDVVAIDGDSRLCWNLQLPTPVHS